MEHSLKRLAFIFLALQICHTITAQKFPIMEEIFVDLLEAEVQLTDENQNATAFAREYFDDSNDMGRLDLLTYGSQSSIFYFRDEGDILEVNETSCVSKPIEDSEYGKIPIFHGWLNKKPFVLGPSALLWFATDDKNKDKIVNKGKKKVRDIDCDWFQLAYKDDKDEITYDYYFAATDWTSPRDIRDLEMRIPVRVEINGYSGQYGGSIPVNQIVDFSYFWPIVDDFTKFEPPIGIGCVNRRSERYLPELSDEFQFVAEDYDLLYAENHADTEVDYRRLFFDYNRQLARMDTYSRSGSKSDLHDFNTGVTYTIQNGETCKIKPLSHSFFENEGDMFQGNMKTAKEVLNLNGEFYYMGNRIHRGINVEVFEKAELKTSLFSMDYYMVVTTVFFLGDSTKDANEGEKMENIPVYVLLTTYDKPNNVVQRRQFNIYAYDDVVGPYIYQDFPIEDCFPLSSQKSYIALIMQDTPDLSTKIKQNNQIFIAEIKSEIMKKGNVSDLRLPFMKIDYQSANIFVTTLLLDRPPALKQFELVFRGPATTSSHLTMVPEARNPEECAYACVDKGITCGIFHFCGAKIPKEGVCFLNKEPLDVPAEDREEFDNCYVYYRAELNSNNKEEYLMKALEKLTYEVENGNFIVKVPLNDDSEVELKVVDIIMGNDPFDITNDHKSYKMIFNGFQLKQADENEATIDKEYVDNELDCYRACKEDETTACQSFSYCPGSSNKQCRISEQFLTKDSPVSDVVANKDCNVYSLMYLDLFEPNPGKVLMRKGDASKKNVETAEECAMFCKMSKDITCRGFEYCKSKKSCVMHSAHLMDVNPSEIVDSKDATCVHYSAKFTADYSNMGHFVIDGIKDPRKDITVEQCARVCSEDVSTCKAFVYCPKEDKFDATCSLTDKTLVSPGANIKINDECYLYSKKDDIYDWGNKPKKADLTSSNYSKRGFAGVVVGTLICGLIVGVVAFMGFSYYKSRQSNDGMTVRFMKQTNA